jgi:hypothetical protein
MPLENLTSTSRFFDPYRLCNSAHSAHSAAFVVNLGDFRLFCPTVARWHFVVGGF